MKIYATLLFIGFFLILSCKVPSIAVSDDLDSNTSTMEVKGRYGWQFNQVIKFGDYTSSKIKKGWTSGSEFTFITRFKRAKQKLSFTQFSPNGSADVFGVGKFKSNELDLLDGFLSVSLKEENYFAGSIIIDSDRNNEWNYIIYNPEGGDFSKNLDCGTIRDGRGNNIEIKGVRKLKNQSSWLISENYGFEFIHQNKVIGAVSTINKGRVWIKNDISDEFKLILSSVSTSLLVRDNLKNN